MKYLPRLLRRFRKSKRLSSERDGFLYPIPRPKGLEQIIVRVSNARKYHGYFHPGELVAQIHLHTVSPRKAVHDLRKLKKEIVPLLKQKGIVGLYSWTPNNVLLSYLSREFDVHAILIHGRERQRTLSAYTEASVDLPYPPLKDRRVWKIFVRFKQ